MAMTVMNNKGAQITAGELNKNDSNLQKALSKVSTGQKIVGADDDSSGYSISERMRMKIRALTQDDQNVQNGSSLVRTAERGVDRIVQTLRTMKELAIDAANDSNTDEDRATIQKELDQCIATIDDIALGTEFNGKILLDGRWAKGGIFIPASGGGGANTTAENVVSGFKEGNSNTVEVAPEVNGGSGDWQFTADKQFTGGNISVQLDFSDMTLSGSYPSALTGQGFTILCNRCKQYINIIFDANKTSAQSTYNPTAGVAEDGSINDLAREYVIGVKGVNNASALAGAIYDGIAALKGKSAKGVQIDKKHVLMIDQDSNGKVFINKNGQNYYDLQFMEGTIPNPLTVPIEPVEVDLKIPRPLWIQAGTQAGQRTHIFIEDMRIEALGINNADVTTQEKANDTIAVISSAIEIALEEATNLGAYLNRMESTAINVTTMNDNVQASESTIRDADMAKEMVTYTKSGLLKQSSQAMFAQANQNGEAVLGLLE